MFQMFTDQIFLSRAGRLRQSKLVSWLELHLLITTRANVRGINLTSHLFCEDQGPETQLDEDCDKGFMMWRENVSVLSGSFDANMGLWFYSRFTWAQTSSLVYLDLMPGPGTIICWELFRLRSVTNFSPKSKIFLHNKSIFITVCVLVYSELNLCFHSCCPSYGCPLAVTPYCLPRKASSELSSAQLSNILFSMDILFMFYT